MYQDVLVPTDGSDGTRRAIRHAMTIAERFDATVHALSVLGEGPYGSLGGDGEGERTAERAVERVETEADRHDLESVTAIRRGVPHEEILAYAEEADVDVIVMGTHGRTGVDRVLVGSVTERVVREATAPVLTVRVIEELRVTDADEAAELVRESLADRGYDEVTVRDEPHRTSGSWIVPVTADGESLHVHLDAATRDVRLAHVEE